MKIEEIKRIINRRKMSHFQILVIAICIAISFVDGYDVMTIAFVIPSISELWSLTPQQVGLLLSAGLIGMVMGALFIAPFADKFGRRVIIIFCLFILTIGMIGSALSNHLMELIVSRVFSGLGIGAIMPCINTVIAEYSSDRYRSLAIGIMAASYTSGSVIGGLIYLLLIKYWGWQYVFFFGAAFSCILIPMVFWLLPESIDFILMKSSAKALARLNSVLKKLDLKTCDTFPEVAKQAHTSKRFPLLFQPQILHSTVLLLISVCMMMLSFYFLINWMPKILVNLGYSKDISITGSLIMNLFGIIGGLSIGWLSRKYSVQKISSLMAVTAFFLVVGFGLSGNILPVLFALIAFSGYTTFGAMAGLYAIVPTIFPPQIRATGTGIVFGLARLGGSFGPYIAGLLIAAQLSQSYCFFLLALPLLLSAACIMAVKPYQKNHCG